MRPEDEDHVHAVGATAGPTHAQQADGPYERQKAPSADDAE